MALDLMSTRQAAAYLGVTRYTVYRLVRAGRIAALKDDRRTDPYLLDGNDVQQVKSEREAGR